MRIKIAWHSYGPEGFALIQVSLRKVYLNNPVRCHKYKCNSNGEIDVFFSATDSLECGVKDEGIKKSHPNYSGDFKSPIFLFIAVILHWEQEMFRK